MILDGIAMDVSLAQFANVDFSMTVIPLGIEKDVKLQ